MPGMRWVDEPVQPTTDDAATAGHEGRPRVARSAGEAAKALGRSLAPYGIAAFFLLCRLFLWVFTIAGSLTMFKLAAEAQSLQLLGAGILVLVSSTGLIFMHIQWKRLYDAGWIVRILPRRRKTA